MALLRHPDTAPPRGWYYFQVETRLRIKADNLGELVKSVIAHRKHMKLGPLDAPTVELEIQRQICSRLGNDHCHSEGPDDPWQPRDDAGSLTLAEIMSASKAAIDFIAGGMEWAPMELVAKRSESCLECPLNERASGCLCAPLYKTLAKLVPSNRRSSELNICRCCKCSLELKINLPDSAVIASNEGRQIQWPIGSCWQKQLMESHVKA